MASPHDLGILLLGGFAKTPPFYVAQHPHRVNSEKALEENNLTSRHKKIPPLGNCAPPYPIELTTKVLEDPNSNFAFDKCLKR